MVSNNSDRFRPIYRWEKEYQKQHHHQEEGHHQEMIGFSNKTRTLRRHNNMEHENTYKKLRRKRKLENARIIGGATALKNRYPYMASLTNERGK